MFWVLVCVALAALVYFALVKPFHYWSDRGVPQYNIWTIWSEILLSFLPYRSMVDTAKKLYNDFSHTRYNGLYRFYLPILFLRDPELIKNITVKDFDHFVDHYNILPENCEPLWEKNLFSLTGDRWRNMRATLSPSFTSSKMKVIFGLISECAKDFIQYFEEKGPNIVTVEMKDVFTRFTTDVIASAAFGVSCNSLRDRDNEFYMMGKAIINFGNVLTNIKIMTIMTLPKLAKILRLSLFNAKATAFFKKVIKENIEAREKNGIVRPDMVHLLLESRKARYKPEAKEEEVVEGFAIVDESSNIKEEMPRKEQLTDDDITAQAFIFFFAGFNSVAIMSCFMAHELAVNPDIQRRLQNEIDDTLNDCKGSVTYEVLMKMKYMDMVLSESLRKWGGGAGADRVCVKPYTIHPVRDGEKPVHLKKGDMVWFPMCGLHRNPQYFPEPDRFDPERFSDENKSNIMPYTYIPFGSGPRSCIGNRFALMEIKLLFFHILSKFDITVVEKTRVPLKLVKSQFDLNAEGGFWLGFKRR